MTNTMFKVAGIPRLISYDELMAIQHNTKIRKVRVIDLKTQKNWSTNLKTVIEKFR